MPKKFYTSLTKDYSVCECGDCPMSATCLHQIAYRQLIDSESYLQLINPRNCTRDEHCPYYRSNAPVRFAKGFTNFQQHMLPGQYKAFMGKLKRVFGRNPYFDRRRGLTVLNVKEQELILRALREVGVTQNLQFDKYIVTPNWCDAPASTEV
ncbi:MAG: hypothetical protein HUK03_08675 [Bacteroidaceae bacterium]|nr:hypothetical protein [Bacteroidaceae bacterium]